MVCRAPHGARGLKQNILGAVKIVFVSRPARGAWIETINAHTVRYNMTQSRPARGAWIETRANHLTSNDSRRRAPHGARGLKRKSYDNRKIFYESRPARGAWIETRSSDAWYPYHLGRVNTIERIDDECEIHKKGVHHIQFIEPCEHPPEALDASE